jgi:hypothetical protein
VAKHTQGIFSLCLVGKVQNMQLKKPMWGWDAQHPLWGNPGTLEQAEIVSLTKRKAHF